jgi:hypothetical protein
MGEGGGCEKRKSKKSLGLFKCIPFADVSHGTGVTLANSSANAFHAPCYGVCTVLKLENSDKSTVHANGFYKNMFFIYF